MFNEQGKLVDALMIQKRVIGALLMREVITRYGRKNIGFLWLFVEPLLAALIITALWYAVRAHEMYSLPMIPFMVTGYALMRMWRTTSARFIGAVSANRGLLYHRNVRLLDVYMARFLLDVAGASVAFILLMTVLVVTGWIKMPDSIFYMLLAWLLMAWFAFGLGLVLAALSERWTFFKKLWSALGIILMVSSGVFFLVDALPQHIQEWILWFPMIHGSEMIRHGYFGDFVRTHENPYYLMLWDVILTFVGLTLLKQQSNEVEFS